MLTCRRLWLVAFSFATLLATAAFTQTPNGNILANLPAETNPAVVKPTLTPEQCLIKNFGQVTGQYFRGAQPKQGEYKQLAALGVKTVIDLRDSTERYAKTQVESAGMSYINVPMSDTKMPPQETVQRFLDLMKDQSIFPIYVHCKGGRHRTGIMTAVYRMTFEGWNIEKAYDEMKDYDFYTRWGHKAMKTFVFKYWDELQLTRKEAAAQPVPTQINQ
jgi:protein tyrosine/serine phosphatase